MKLWKKSNEAFVKKMGWIKKKGWRIDIDEISDVDHWDNIYFECLSDYVQKAEYWEHPTHSEQVYEDVDLIIENEYEEYFDDKNNLWDEPVQDI